MIIAWVGEDATGFRLKADGVVKKVTVHVVHGGGTCAMRVQAISLCFALVKAMPVIGNGIINLNREIRNYRRGYREQN